MFFSIFSTDLLCIGQKYLFVRPVNLILMPEHITKSFQKHQKNLPFTNFGFLIVIFK